MVELCHFEVKKTAGYPLAVSRVSAGFPSPAEDYVEGKLDLNEYLVKHPAATFFVRVSGESMEGAGIYTGDILVVDRALYPGEGHIVIAAVEGELTVKRLKRIGDALYLAPEHPEYPLLKISEAENIEIWGVVTYAIHAMGEKER
jgi:DNA polymerase V